jgi:o-succinylbenzoate---CoA ligase
VHRLVVVEARASDEFVDRLQRAWGDGDAVLPLDHRLPPPARERLLGVAQPGEPVADGDALVVATSGTSGEPKAVVLTQDAVAASARATSRWLGVDAGSDRWLACLPLAHVGGLSVVTRALATGTPLTLHDGFDPAAVAAAAAGGCTLTSLVPTMLRRLGPAAVRCFRAVVLGGSAMPPDLPPNAVTTYGMTETGSGVVYDGVPLDGVEVRVVEGEIHLRGPMLLRAYRDGSDPKDTDGWFPTGDGGAWDEAAGRLRVFGRMGDLIVTGGENVWPVAVERALEAHPGVRQVAVVGRPDPEWGQRVVALVVAADPAAPPSLDELRDTARRELPAYAAPRELVLAAELPQTGSGKLARARLPALAAGADPSTASPSPPARRRRPRGYGR